MFDPKKKFDPANLSDEEKKELEKLDKIAREGVAALSPYFERGEVNEVEMLLILEAMKRSFVMSVVATAIEHGGVQVMPTQAVGNA